MSATTEFTVFFGNHAFTKQLVLTIKNVDETESLYKRYEISPASIWEKIIGYRGYRGKYIYVWINGKEESIPFSHQYIW